MKTHSQLVMSALMILAGGAVLWFLHWFLLCQLEGWTIIKNTCMQAMSTPHITMISPGELKNQQVRILCKALKIEIKKELTPTNNTHLPPEK